jgi:hypothetical protein
MTASQHGAITELAHRYGVTLRWNDVLMDLDGKGIIGLPAGWASVVLRLDDGRVIAAGVSPEGRVST